MRRFAMTAPWPEGPVVVPATAAFEDVARRAATAWGATLMEAERFLVHPSPGVVVWIDGGGPALRGPPRGAAPRRPPPPPTRPRPGLDPLLRALPRSPAGLEVIDATAGWGADAGLLAAAGARVTMIERAPVVAALLAAALERWRAEGHPAADRLTLVAADAREALVGLTADVVLLDPFFEGREEATTTAAPLRWLRVAGRWRVAPPGEDDAALLLRAARAAARSRVVVKRPAGAAPFAGVRPSGSLAGRVVRYDLYAPTHGAS
jgi:hypothetical protein